MNNCFLSLVLVLGVVTAENWSVSREKNGTTCIILAADPVIHVKFVEGNTTYSYSLAINKTSSVDGKCDFVHEKRAAQTLTVRFFPNGVTPPATSGQEWILDFIFGSDETKGAFQLVDYKLTTSPQESLNGSATKVFNKIATSETDVNAGSTNGFKCSSTGLQLSDESSIELKNIRVLAFANLADKEFPHEQVFEQCLADARTSDVVPIIVGACLAGLVVIVLVAYLIGRARAKRQGYASV